MKRVLIGTMTHEVGSFHPMHSGYDEFHHLWGQDILEAFNGGGSTTWGAIEVLKERDDVEIVPTYAAWMNTTGGLVEKAAQERMIAEFIEAVQGESNIDAVVLCLHGAMAGVDVHDPEGDVAEAVRKHVGDVPITTPMDLHGIITDKLLANVDAISFLHTYPHVDGRETGNRAARNVLRMMDGEFKNPVTGRVKIPMLARGNELMTATGKFGEAIRRCQEIEASEGGIAAGVNIGNPFTDVPELRSNTIVTVDGDQERADALAHELAEFMWEHRNLWFADLTPMKEIVELSENQDGLTVCGDPADSTASGSSGDSNAILKGLLEHEYSKSALVPIVDAPAVAKAFEVGVGSTFTVKLGGSIDTERFEPLEAEVYVRALTDGEHGGRRGKVPARAGRTATFRLKQHTVVASERPAATTDSTFFLAQGEDPLQYDFVIAKSPNGFRIFYQEYANQILYADVPGSTSADVTTLPYKLAPRPMFPLDEDVEPGF
ncbi:MAG: microcystin degradation protein MlrC [Gemmatimonadetes bacterium]|nr:microcystin degradation protein MlrC [Gemmatimonadota bacterium]